MVDNIEKVLERGEKIELLVDKSENLRDRVSHSCQVLPAGPAKCVRPTDAWRFLYLPISLQQANEFQTKGRQLRRKMWWNNVKIKIFLAVLVLVIVIIIFLITCFSGGNCFKN